MGQYWMIANIDKRQHLGEWGKLGEFFFDGSANTLVDYLAVPSSESPNSIHKYSPVTGDWAGDRIVCVGDYVEDVPEGVLSRREIREFARLTRQAAYESDSDEEDEEGQQYKQRDMNYLSLSDAASEYFEELPNRFFSKEGFAKDKVYVLRNLTKREYVRADAVHLYRDEFKGPFLAESAWGHHPGLGQVLLSRISWSSDSTASMNYDDEGVGIARGVWAGDRFDIVIIDAVVSDSGQWRDVSKEVAEEVFAIYTSEFGETWKESGREWVQ